MLLIIVIALILVYFIYLRINSLFLYLDESGDLGFDFKNKNPSRFFVITLLQTKPKWNKLIGKAVAKTLDNKINYKNKRKPATELKGNNTNLKVKQYFLEQMIKRVPQIPLYSIVLDKQRLLKKHSKPVRTNVYNQMTHQLLEQIDFSEIDNLQLVLDRCKNGRNVDAYLSANLSLCLDVETKLYVEHVDSQEHKGVQAVDLFCHGIARKYELGDYDWYDEFMENIVVECEFKI